jgi:CelD/BcsL family acetyltransferase involved in cellulose biosynthesis
VQLDHFPDWDRIILDNIQESSPLLQAIEEYADQTDLTFETSVIQPAPFIKLPQSWEDYLLGLEDRYRQEIERKIRKAESYFLPVDWYIVDESQDLKSEMNDFLELMANNPDKKKFLTKKMVGQMVSGTEAAFQEGWLQLAFLIVGDQKIGGYLNFDFNNKIWIYNSGINPLFENLSPGCVLLGKLIQWAIQEGKSEVDFMRGDEKYKYQFGGIDKQVTQLILSK